MSNDARWQSSQIALRHRCASSAAAATSTSTAPTPRAMTPLAVGATSVATVTAGNPTPFIFDDEHRRSPEHPM